jgi:hypothetical protein
MDVLEFSYSAVDACVSLSCILSVTGCNAELCSDVLSVPRVLAINKADVVVRLLDTAQLLGP